MAIMPTDDPDDAVESDILEPNIIMPEEHEPADPDEAPPEITLPDDVVPPDLSHLHPDEFDDVEPIPAPDSDAEPSPPGPASIGTDCRFLREQVLCLREEHAKARSGRTLVAAIYNLILVEEVLIRKSRFFTTPAPAKVPYVCLGSTNQTLEVSSHPQNADFATYIFFTYGLPPDEITAAVITIWRLYINKIGDARELRRFVCYKPESRTLFVSNYDGEVFRLRGEAAPEFVKNGTGCYFRDDDGGVPVNTDDSQPVNAAGIPPVVFGPHNELIPTLINQMNFPEETSEGTPAEVQRYLMIAWIFTLAFPDLLPAKPILILEGPPGSGKTAVLQMIQLALQGSSKTRMINPNDQASFPVQLIRAPICLLDNVDTLVRWLQDALAAYATGGSWTKRKLYSDDQEVEIKPTAFLAITTNNPITFKRDDVTARSLIVRLEERISYTPFQDVLDTIASRRWLLFGEWIWYLNKIVGELRSPQGRPPRIYEHRLGDWARLCEVILRVVFRVQMGGTPTEAQISESNQRAYEMTLAILHASRNERENVMMSEDLLSLALHKWISKPSNQGRKILSATLHSELKAELQAYAEEKSPLQSMTMRLRGKRSAFLKGYVIKHVNVDRRVYFKITPKKVAADVQIDPDYDWEMDGENLPAEGEESGS